MKINWDDVEEVENNYSLMPEGTILELLCTNCEHKTSKAGNSTYFALEFTSCGEVYNGRKIWQNFMWSFENPTDGQRKAVNIAKSNLKTMTGIMNKRDASPEEWVTGLVYAYIGIDKGKNGYPDRNKVSRFLTRQEALEAANKKKNEVKKMKEDFDNDTVPF